MMSVRRRGKLVLRGLVRGRKAALLAVPMWLAAVASAWAQAPAVGAKSAVLVDVGTGQVLYQVAAHERRPVASTTKIMTALIALESAHLDDWVVVSADATQVEPSVLDLKPGEQVRLQDLLAGLLLKSANDAAVAIAEHVSGSVEKFSERMNERARELGARDTHFVNPHGLYDPNHYSSAYDLALITREALKHPRFRELVGTKAAEVFRPYTVGTETVENHNRLLWETDYVDGVKTGYVSKAGQCIVASATKDEWQLLAVLLDSPDKYGEALQLLNYGFSTFQRKVYARKGDVLDRVPVERGRSRQVEAVCAEALAGVTGPGMPDGGRLELKRKRLVAPVAKGAAVGEAQLVVGGKVVARSPLVASAPVPVSWLAVCWAWGWRTLAALAALAVTVRVSAKGIKAYRRRRSRFPPQVRGVDPGRPSAP